MYRAGELRQKEVINLADARRLGFVSDVEVSLEAGAIDAIIVPGKNKMFNFSRGGDLVIPWEKIKRIGEDVILVDINTEKEV
ncbi:MAG: YlmC/YmxH family sporulation protein [Ruminococcaceae bacterium]|nr:YlmC/YmxH family sporulation protein [Oscillospiraceae bacterium]